jgi:hypothetical protein
MGVKKSQDKITVRRIELKVFVIPDIHLKPWMIKKAEQIVNMNRFDEIVILGDIVDDWNQEENLELYRETLDTVAGFVKRHQETVFCYGNHDISYFYNAYESGYSPYAKETVIEGINNIVYSLPKENVGFIHRIDDVIFSHAGLTERFVLNYFGYEEKYDIDRIIRKINKMGKSELWTNDSPIWARPQMNNMRLYPDDMLQVVGHTPVVVAQKEKNLISLDTFSTYRNGKTIGDEIFVCIDTETESIKHLI